MKLRFENVSHYRYRLVDEYVYEQKLILPKTNIVTPFIKLDVDGKITLAKGYAWDGASGPVISQKVVARASLLHDALYQLMRLKKLDLSYRELADMLFRDVCIDDGVSKIVASMYYRAVRVFGEQYASCEDKAPDIEEV